MGEDVADEPGQEGLVPQGGQVRPVLCDRGLLLKGPVAIISREGISHLLTQHPLGVGLLRDAAVKLFYHLLQFGLTHQKWHV